ncbi:glycosyltransferase [Oxalobacter sp. OttesenSCG-928-P03]|nr:glycosyltransferase [Oxalobacter sp. OttesenSCG-928-P03]
MSFKTSVIISTYNSPEWLEKVLWGYGNQNFRDFQILIADDGSTAETADVVRDFQNNSGMEIEHLWHQDDGCQKSVMLNKSVMRAKGDYLIFVEGHCVPRKDFVSVHVKSARPNHFLSGGHTNLPMCCSIRVDEESILSGKLFNIVWLQQNGYPDTAKKLRMVLMRPFSNLFNLIPTPNKWNGRNASGWKKDIIGVNGFDERMKHGGADRELGERLKHAGVKAKRIRYTAVSVHLSHDMGYINGAYDPENVTIFNETLDKKSRFTKFGIFKS